jgi:hypothetical protein
MMSSRARATATQNARQLVYPSLAVALLPALLSLVADGAQVYRCSPSVQISSQYRTLSKPNELELFARAAVARRLRSVAGGWGPGDRGRRHPYGKTLSKIDWAGYMTLIGEECDHGRGT